jgi:hypothetical protein
LKQTLQKIDWSIIVKVTLAAFLLFAPVFASTTFALTDPGCPTGINCTKDTDLNKFILRIINIILGVTLAIDVLFLIIGGFFYITSAGNEERASKGKTTVINAIIGLVIIVLSYVIANVVALTNLFVVFFRRPSPY